MFSLIRGVIIIGLIFYFSPERDTGEPEQPAPSGERRPVATLSPPASEDGNNGLWARIVDSLSEEVFRTAVESKAEEIGLDLKETSWVPAPPAKTASAETLRTAERDAAGRAGAGQAVRCIYRCDGAE